MNAPKKLDLATSYNRIAQKYSEDFFNELDHKPFDRTFLERFADLVRGKGPVCDMGCGPGQITRYLHDLGVDAFGIDISDGMVEEARRLNPDIKFFQGNMLGLDAPDNTWAGISMFYSIIHIPRPQVVDALRELKRVLEPGGFFLLTIHIGEEDLHLDEWQGKQVNLDYYLFQPAEMENYLKEAGFKLVETIVRPPYPEIEYQSHRAYILSRKPLA